MDFVLVTALYLKPLSYILAFMQQKAIPVLSGYSFSERVTAEEQRWWGGVATIGLVIPSIVEHSAPLSSTTVFCECRN